MRHLGITHCQSSLPFLLRVTTALELALASTEVPRCHSRYLRKRVHTFAKHLANESESSLYTLTEFQIETRRVFGWNRKDCLIVFTDKGVQRGWNALKTGVFQPGVLRSSYSQGWLLQGPGQKDFFNPEIPWPPVIMGELWPSLEGEVLHQFLLWWECYLEELKNSVSVSPLRGNQDSALEVAN